MSAATARNASRRAKAKTSKKISKKPAKKSVKRPAKKSAAPASARPFRYTAAQIVQLRFKGDKKPESFRVDDMAEASLATLDGQTKLYFQYRLVSNDRQNQDGSDRIFWLFDPKPVGAADTIVPSLWQPVSERPMDGHSVVASHSGNFSTRSVTGYDGSGACHVVKLGDGYRMRFDFNGKREFCESIPMAVGKGDVLSVPRAR
jgi:hypothetical protein